MATSQNDRWRKEQREEKKTDPGPFGVQMKRNRLRDWKHTVALGGAAGWAANQQPAGHQFKTHQR